MVEQLTMDNETLRKDNEQSRKDKNDLQGQLDGVMVANAQLTSCNSLLRSKCDDMLEQLSVKEAQWSHREEELQLQVGLLVECIMSSSVDTPSHCVEGNVA